MAKVKFILENFNLFSFRYILNRQSGNYGYLRRSRRWPDTNFNPLTFTDMKTLIFCFKNGILLEITAAAYPLFVDFNWHNFNQGDNIYLDGELFGTFDFLNAEAGTNLQIVSINL